MTEPLVTIVIPSFNYARFLPEAIESALAQTHPAIEVIVIDDGSSDDSVEIARRYPVRVITQENRGVARTRNRGAQEAHGELIVFLDADDVLLPTFVETCWRALRTCGPTVAFAYAGTEKFGSEEGILPTRAFDGQSLFDGGNYITVTTLLRRDVFLREGGFDPTWPAHEDAELWARLFARGYRGTFVREPLLRYRFHGRSRNSRSLEHKRDLHVRLVLAHPRYGWRWMMRHPLWTAESALRLALHAIADRAQRVGGRRR